MSIPKEPPTQSPETYSVGLSTSRSEKARKIPQDLHPEARLGGRTRYPEMSQLNATCPSAG